MHHHVQAETKTLFRIILWYRILILLSPSHKWAQGSRSYKMCASSTDGNEETDPWIQLSAIKPDIVRLQNQKMTKLILLLLVSQAKVIWPLKSYS